MRPLAMSLGEQRPAVIMVSICSASAGTVRNSVIRRRSGVDSRLTLPRSAGSRNGDGVVVRGRVAGGLVVSGAVFRNVSRRGTGAVSGSVINTARFEMFAEA